MIAALAFLQSHWRAAALGVLTGLALLALACVYVKGRNDGFALATANAKQELIDQLNQRGKIDGVVEQLDNSDLCLALGRVWRNGQCE